MITFKQFLMERADYPLYHGTGFNQLIKIIDSNTLKTGVPVEIHWPSKNRAIVSLSRNYNFAKKWAEDISYDPVVIQLSRGKLAHNYKITPFNFFADKARRYQSRSTWDGMDVNQYEEAVNRDIKDVMKYVDAIYMDKSLASIAKNSSIWDEIEEYVVFGDPSRR